MDKVETIEEFYKRKFDWMPENIQNNIGHFNVFKIIPFVGQKARPVPYARRDFYKVTLAIGEGDIHYADKIIKARKQALVFSNPSIPYKWENNERMTGFYCIFNKRFFHQYGNLEEYSLFQPNGVHWFELTKEQIKPIEAVYERMFAEIKSEYVHKYDVLRGLVLELIHTAMKMQPAAQLEKQPINAAKRISSMFMELLERQFPIDENHPQVHFRSPSDFASQLNVHVNHLNRAVKEITEKTTSQIIADRIVQESKVLLKHSTWNVSEIADSLGFAEVTHFDNFFKKHTRLSPSKFRHV